MVRKEFNHGLRAGGPKRMHTDLTVGNKGNEEETESWLDRTMEVRGQKSELDECRADAQDRKFRSLDWSGLVR